MALIVTVAGRTPQLHPDSWAAPNASIVGNVTIAAQASIWYSATLRAENESIEIGLGSNIQDGACVHVDPDFPCVVGTGVSVGHNVVLHGCTIEDHALVGMGAIVLNGAVVGGESIIGAGAVVRQGMVIPKRSLVTGVPGRVVRELTDAEIAGNRHAAAQYQQRIDVYRDAEGATAAGRAARP
ncbi:gamma carbonic anhydrase family protein [Mycobacterium sp. MS1601]|uniref:gamma carbonic anhydrase family protein n=1 Tax=Mycobacterium sp. MS1601 TaxID=1936029 RepID=UPI00097934E1|nr:gamma carbonic anhydrase family protein [Mycobacterium sp. MS1601]AQA04027.1 gamma carbonic anhydrase family protein [Mycobacterium sp. MS1601]